MKWGQKNIHIITNTKYISWLSKCKKKKT